MNKQTLAKRLLEQLTTEPTSLYNLYEVYSLAFDINEVIDAEGDHANMFPQNNKLGVVLSQHEKVSEVALTPITSSFTEDDFSKIHNSYLNFVKKVLS